MKGFIVLPSLSTPTHPPSCSLHQKHQPRSCSQILSRKGDSSVESVFGEEPRFSQNSPHPHPPSLFPPALPQGSVFLKSVRAPSPSPPTEDYWKHASDVCSMSSPTHGRGTQAPLNPADVHVTQAGKTLLPFNSPDATEPKVEEKNFCDI